MLNNSIFVPYSFFIFIANFVLRIFSCGSGSSSENDVSSTKAFSSSINQHSFIQFCKSFICSFFTKCITLNWFSHILANYAMQVKYVTKTMTLVVIKIFIPSVLIALHKHSPISPLLYSFAFSL